jgi:hypothetical protein
MEGDFRYSCYQYFPLILGYKNNMVLLRPFLKIVECVIGVLQPTMWKGNFQPSCAKNCT